MERREFLERGLAMAMGLSLQSMSSRSPQSAPRLAAASGLPSTEALTGHVILRGQPGYDAARQVKNARFDRYPAAIVYCRSGADVARAVDWARTNDIPLRARCGGHSYECYSLVDDGLVIDVSRIRRVRYDSARQTVRVGAGETLLSLYRMLWRHHVTVPGGSCPSVGISGLTLGGGYGLLARRHGLTCDNLLAVEIVMADGRIVRADPQHHPDLFWACRGGGGGNFGIATEFTFRTHPIGRVSIYNIVWDWGDLEAVLNAWQAWAPQVDDRLTSILKLKAQSNGTISSTGQFLGSSDELAMLLRPLLAAGTPQAIYLKTVDYKDAVLIFAGLKPDHAHWPVYGHGDRTPFKGASDYADRLLDPAGLSTLRHYLERAPSASCLVQIENYGGAIARIPPDATAFPHRAGTLFGLQYQAYWSASASGAPNIAWVSGLRQAMQTFVSGRAYANYIDSALARNPQAYYGVNYPRLQRVKARYDPADLFRFPQEIVMADG